MTQVTHARPAAHVPIRALGWSLGLFLAILYTICVVFDLVFPGQSMTALWAPLLPWVEGISVASYALGLIETLLYGWLAALIFGPLFNFFSEKYA
ncbi:MAG: DUF5676 family membrane protein [Paracoccaceae bacterium]|nr:DUF5676 family membrane protein [Paracoccaceae bacterium]MDP7186990.1 DUF5676 family membrane protein [Paracoccaceae bacterium]